MAAPSPTSATEPFPEVDASGTPTAPGRSATSGTTRSRKSTQTKNRSAASSSLSGRLRTISQDFGHSELPEGFFAATGSIASTIVTSAAPQGRAAPVASSPTTRTSSQFPAVVPTRQEAIPEHENEHEQTGRADPLASEAGTSTESKNATPAEPAAAAPFPNGYHFPPKHSFAQSCKLGSVAFWKYFCTPLGFCVTIYGLNVVAWGGMLFLLLCNASPAMCYPTCNDINSPRRKWIEWDSQILNALFCVTGFGLAPWRFRDLYFLMKYRLLNRPLALRRLAAIHRGWFRLPGSQELQVSLGPQNVEASGLAEDSMVVPFPEKKIPDAPLTGMRARATLIWKLDLVIWLMVWNTFFQCCLSGFMWGMNRYDRPSWSTGLFVALACIVAGVGGIIMFVEGNAVKKVEGVPVSQEDMERLEHDREQGIWHFNNIDDKDAEEEKAKKEREKDKKGKQHKYMDKEDEKKLEKLELGVDQKDASTST